MDRPAVDVIVPFRGSAAELDAVRARLAVLQLGPRDTLTVVDNSPAPHGTADVAAPDLQTPGYARNRGAELGRAPWLVFVDADVTVPAGLLADYFAEVPGDATALLAGEIRDEPGPGAAARYSHLRGAMSQEITLARGEWAFAQTANCALRRAAFSAVGGFTEPIRAGEDADLCYRLRSAGWGIERRPGAVVTHRSRSTVRGLVAQQAVHGAAGGWLNRRYPGSFPPRRVPGLMWWVVRHTVGGLLRAARTRRRDEALLAVMDPLTILAYEAGRALPNRRPLRSRG